MIQAIHREDDFQPDYSVSYRETAPATRKSIALAARLDAKGERKQANQARYQRCRGSTQFSGLHRRRDKRNVL